MKLYLKKSLHLARKAIKSNMPSILSYASIIGLGGTFIFACRGTKKLCDKETPSLRDKLKCYYPAILTGMVTTACILSADRINKRTREGLAASCVLLENAYHKYKDKVDECFGDGISDAVEDEIAKDIYKESGVPEDQDDGKELFYDEFSHRYFRSTMEDVLLAEYHFNRNLALRGDACLNEFYSFLSSEPELEPIDAGEELGWDLYFGEINGGYKWVDFWHRKTVLDDGLECTIISMPFPPMPFDELREV